MTTTAIRMGVVAALACVLACGRHLNPEFCATHPDDPQCMTAGDAMGEPALPCTTNQDCKGGTPVCDTNRHECVMCTPDQNLCHEPTPICDSNDTCQPMTCPSDVILPDTGCVDATQVIYVQTGGDTGTDCSQARPCSLSEGLVHLRPNHIIHLADGSYPGPHTFDITDITVTFFGLHATLTGGVTIPQNSLIELDYVTVSGGATGGVVCGSGAHLTIHGASVRNNAGGYGLTSQCTLAMDSASIFNNPNEGGLHITGGMFEVHNTAIFNNGSGGLRSSPVLVEGGSGHFTFNTVTHNTVKGGGGGAAASGVECNVATAAIGNIIAANSGANQTALSGGCNVNDSYISDTASEILWRNFPPATADDLHLTVNSPSSVKNVSGLDCSAVPKDFEAEMRPMGGACDRGIDEYKE